MDPWTFNWGAWRLGRGKFEINFKILNLIWTHGHLIGVPGDLVVENLEFRFRFKIKNFVRTHGHSIGVPEDLVEEHYLKIEGQL